MISNFISKTSGKAVPNQYLISKQSGLFFQSYDSVIAFLSHDKRTIIFTEKWNYSQTTVKYLKQFLGTSLTTKQIKTRILSGNIKIDNNLKCL